MNNPIKARVRKERMHLEIHFYKSSCTDKRQKVYALTL